MSALLLVPVLVRVISHAGGRGVNWRLIGTLPPVGRIHHCITLDAVVAVAAALVVFFPHCWRRRRVAGHGVTGVWTVFKRNVPKWKLAVLVELLKL